MVIKIKKCSTKKFIKNSEKILKVLCLLQFFCKVIVFELKIIENVYMYMYKNIQNAFDKHFTFL